VDEKKDGDFERGKLADHNTLFFVGFCKIHMNYLNILFEIL
jgi:hypothetical protein